MTDLSDLIGDIFPSFAGVRNPRTGQVIRFDLKAGEHKYNYFQHKGSSYEYCYTPHKDVDGWYYSWTYLPKGEGARTGQARHWTLRKLQAHRTRKGAKARALKMYRAEH